MWWFPFSTFTLGRYTWNDWLKSLTFLSHKHSWSDKKDDNFFYKLMFQRARTLPASLRGAARKRRVTVADRINIHCWMVMKKNFNYDSLFVILALKKSSMRWRTFSIPWIIVKTETLPERQTTKQTRNTQARAIKRDSVSCNTFPYCLQSLYFGLLW